MYTVEWTQLALSRLAELMTSLSSADWARKTHAIEVLDLRLQNSPMQVGESRDRAVRIAFVGPLIVSFEIDQADRRVTVLAVSWRGTKGM